MTTEELREKIAELEHKQWVKWSQAVADEVATSRRARWKLLWIPYSELTEEQKEQDRVWADKSLKVCQEAGLAFVVKDAKVPQRRRYKRPVINANNLVELYYLGQIDAQEAMKEAGWEKTEEM